MVKVLFSGNRRTSGQKGQGEMGGVVGRRWSMQWSGIVGKGGGGEWGLRE